MSAISVSPSLASVGAPSSDDESALPTPTDFSDVNKLEANLAKRTHRSQYSQVEFIRSPSLPYISAARTRVDSFQGLQRRSTVSDKAESPPRPVLPRSTTVTTFSEVHPQPTANLRLENLPANPKEWLPSQLALYLAHVLRLTARPMIKDMVSMVISKGLTGRRFLRLREADFRELEINPAWAKAMADARDKLHHECLRRQIMGISADDFQAKQTDTLQIVSDAAGKHSRGRVKSIASYFEDAKASHGMEASTDSNWTVHSQDATTSSADVSFPKQNTTGIRIVPESPEQSMTTEVVQGSDDESDVESVSSNADLSIDWSTVAPISPESPDTFQADLQGAEHDRQLSGYAASTESLGTATGTQAPYQSRITSHADAYSPIRGLPAEWVASMDQARQGFGIDASSTTRVPTQLESVFKQPLQADDGLGELKSRNGSLIVVKKSQLVQLEQRMSEMESLLEDLQSTKEQPQVEEKPKALEDMSLTSLGGYVLMTALGVGIVVAEVLVSKVFRHR